MLCQAGKFDQQVILDYLKNKLPNYMVPLILVELTDLLLIVNGKVDKKSSGDVETGSALEEYVPTQTPIEHTLLTCETELL
jgi:hypothetical protein